MMCYYLNVHFQDQRVKQGIIVSSMGKEMKIISWEQGFLYITE